VLVGTAFLFYFGTGTVRGFAVTLSLGVLASMFTAVFASHALVDLLLTPAMQTAGNFSVRRCCYDVQRENPDLGHCWQDAHVVYGIVRDHCYRHCGHGREHFQLRFTAQAWH